MFGNSINNFCISAVTDAIYWTGQRCSMTKDDPLQDTPMLNAIHVLSPKCLWPPPTSPLGIFKTYTLLRAIA